LISTFEEKYNDSNGDFWPFWDVYVIKWMMALRFFRFNFEDEWRGAEHGKSWGSNVMVELRRRFRGKAGYSIIIWSTGVSIYFSGSCCLLMDSRFWNLESLFFNFPLPVKVIIPWSLSGKERRKGGFSFLLAAVSH
jgi:hypothetical protein